MSNTRNRAFRNGKVVTQGKRAKAGRTTVRVLVDEALKLAYSRYAPGTETAKTLRSALKGKSLPLN